MKNLSLEEFARLINTGKYDGSVAEARKTDGDFAGPVGQFKVDEESFSVSIAPCAVKTRKGWVVKSPEGLLISFSFAEAAKVNLDDAGRLSCYFYRRGTVFIYPKDHLFAIRLPRLIQAKETAAAA